MELHIAGPLELLEDDLIHPASGIDQRGGDDRQAAAVLDVPGGPEEPLRLVEGVGIDAAGKDLAGRRHDRVVGAGQAGDAVQQDDDILFMLHQTLGLLDHHLGHLDMARCRLVECGGDHLSGHAPLHVRHLFRPLVDQQDHQDDLLVVGRDAVGDVLQQDGLAGPRRGDDQTALPLSDRGEHVHDARGEILRVELQIQFFLRVEGGQVVEKDLVAGRFRPLEVDFVHLEEGEILLPFLGGTDLAGNGVPRPQAEAPDLRGGDVDVVRTGEVVVIHRAEESEAVRQDLENSGPGDHAVFLGLGLQDGKNQILPSHAAGARDVEVLGQFCQFTDRLSFDIFDVHFRFPSKKCALIRIRRCKHPLRMNNRYRLWLVFIHPKLL